MTWNSTSSSGGEFLIMPNCVLFQIVYYCVKMLDHGE